MLCEVLLVINIRIRNFRRFLHDEIFLPMKISRITGLWLSSKDCWPQVETNIELVYSVFGVDFFGEGVWMDN